MPNTLYYGDNLEVLRKYIHDETVDLCYIDPPFNSKRNYNQIYNNIGGEDRAQAQAFVDTWTWDSEADKGWTEILANHETRFNHKTIELIKGLHNVLGKGSLLAYVISMTLRAVEIRRALKSTGSFYLHCDTTASHYLKLILDTVFLSKGGDYRNEIIWKRTSSHSDATRYARVHDVILYYVKNSDKIRWNPVYEAFDEKYVEQYYRYKDDDGRRFMSGDLSAAGLSGGGYTYEWKGITRLWRCPITTMQKYEDEKRIFYTRNGIPRMKRYLDESKGLPASDAWTDIEALRSWHAEKLGYPTQKPEALLERIIRASSNEGDTILDAYCGCGTTIAVAQSLNRNWIGIDITYQSISLILRRLESQFGKPVADAVILNGIPQDIASAEALAHKKDDRVRKEFEKWAVLTYTNNRAIINEKKGGDGGVDGRAYFQTSKIDNAKIILQVKSGHVGRGDIAKLRGDMAREQAEMGVFITLDTPSQSMTAEAKDAGAYFHNLMGRSYDRIPIVTIREIVEQQKRLDIPMSLEVLKSAQLKAANGQMSLLDA